MKHLRFLVEESKSDSHMFCSPLHNNASLRVGILLVNRCINILFISLHILSFIMMPRKTSFITVFSQFPAFLYFICKSLKPHYILSNIQWEQKQACSITNPLPNSLSVTESDILFPHIVTVFFKVMSLSKYQVT